MSFFGGILKAALPVAASFIPGVGPIAGAAVGAALSGTGNQNRANALSNQAGRIAMGNWNQTAPLRSRALEMALAPRAPREDTSALFADPGNPYSRVVPRPPVAASTNSLRPGAAPRSQTETRSGNIAAGVAPGGAPSLLERALGARALGPDGLVRRILR